MTADPPVLREKRGCLGLLTLNRPAALNALTHDMVRRVRDTLDEWADDPAIAVVAIRGAGERAFCAGADVRALAAGTPEAALDFLRDEYRLNDRISAYPKPYVALLHGITMGGGAGLSVHGRYRVADASLVFAMPEVAIGFVPDVGASYFLPRCPDGIGMYLALTAGRIGLDDACHAGLMTHAMPAARFDAVLKRLADGEAAGEAIAALAASPDAAPLAMQAERLAMLFGGGTVEAILERCARDGGDVARGVADAMRSHSPTALKYSFRLLRAGGARSLRECLMQEFRVAAHVLRGGEFREGVRAALIDKDRAPRWSPAVLAALEPGNIEAFFAPPSCGDLTWR